MKTIKDYLIREAQKIKKASENTYDEALAKANLMIANAEKKNELFVVYKDVYHGCMHISNIYDMLVGMAIYKDDFEDISPKYIVASFPTIKEAALYVLNNYCPCLSKYGKIKNINDYINAISAWSGESIKEVRDNINDYIYDLDVYDKPEFIASVMTDEETNKTNLDGQGREYFDDMFEEQWNM